MGVTVLGIQHRAGEFQGVHYDNYNLHCTISIHALLAESDDRHSENCQARQGFLSTLSLRRATA